jgi:hypothetical protein
MAEPCTNQGEMGGLAKSERARECEREWTGRRDAMCPSLDLSLSLSAVFESNLLLSPFQKIYFHSYSQGQKLNQPPWLLSLPLYPNNKNKNEGNMSDPWRFTPRGNICLSRNAHSQLLSAIAERLGRRADLS